MTVLLLILIPAALFLIYLWLIHPGPVRGMDHFTGRAYAHRGLWDDRLPENSLPAVRRAAALGFGIETDVHLTADDQLVIFHDSDLSRMCGVSRPIEACTLEELRQYRLLGTKETIPTLRELLDAVGGRVPLIVEIKPARRVKRLCERLDEALRDYRGPYVIESFDPRAVHWYRRHRPDVIRGQLTFGLNGRGVVKKNALTRLLATQALNVLGRPDFIAAEAASDGGLALRLLRLFPTHFAAWTVRSPEQMEALRDRYEIQIFEHFIPGEVSQ